MQQHHPRPTHPRATHALVAAAVALTCCPVVPALFALSFANQAERAIAGSGGRYGGESQITAARILAWFHLAMAAGGLAMFLVTLALGTLAEA